MTAAAGFLAGRHTVLQPSLRSSGSSPRQPHLAAQRRPMHQARPDRRLVGGVAAAAATPATSAAAPQPSAASSANGSQAPDGELAAQAHLQASAARRSAHDGAEPMASSSPPQQHEPAHHHELHDISEHSMRRLRKEMEELRQLMVTQGRLIEQQQRTIRDMEGQLATRSGSESEGERAGEAEAETTAALRELQLREARGFPAYPVDLGGQLPHADLGDRRVLGGYDARFHSTSWGATPRDFRLLPRRIVLVRHAQSEGNVDNFQYTYVPDPKVPLTAKGWEQALDAGEQLRSILDGDGSPYRLFFYTSPYLRSKQTYEGLVQAFEPEHLLGVQEEVQLREQDFGNFQDAEGKKREKAERLRFGRFFYRFPNGESGADVYDRMTIFEDHLVRDINAGRYGRDATLVLVTHGLASRIFLMRWFHWTVDQFMNVFNPPNAEPIVMERITSDLESRPGGPTCWIHTKALYRLTDASMDKLVGCTEDMCSTSWLPRGIDSPREYSSH